jgi:hypothetical protein
MATDISSLSFREDALIWTELSIQDNALLVKKAAYDSLPSFLNHKSIHQEATIAKLAEFIANFKEKNQFTAHNLKITIPGRFTVIKKVLVDATISKENFGDLVSFEFEKSWDESPKNYSIYIPEYSRTRGPYKEILAVAIRNKVLEFFDAIFNKLDIEVKGLTPSCFTIDEFFRAQVSNISGISLLIGFQNRGYDLILVDSLNFLKYSFRPYNNNIDQLSKIAPEEIIGNFKKVVSEIQKPSKLSEPLHDIDSIYLYGTYLNPVWSEMIQSKLQTPVQVFSFQDSSLYSLKQNSVEEVKKNVFRYIEPLSNIF